MKKKILFSAMMGISVMALAKTIQATWTSTCGVKHITTFTGDWSQSEMALWIAEKNADECGNYPSSVTFNP
ncbi:hypothetical protein [Chryseobacterium sp. EO14]|uniref:hypothetical protein n=1 Tax=Chryseobacterium sp. EO14 TaxID=2950551 RepID=UPI00210A6384|nr:hypothetical protein [Chryseobacterium sp. EO14]MCQ4140325.1 hypothetical protein [Chryseobacterium sp. EO14]